MIPITQNYIKQLCKEQLRLVKEAKLPTSLNERKVYSVGFLSGINLITDYEFDDTIIQTIVAIDQI